MSNIETLFPQDRRRQADAEAEQPAAASTSIGVTRTNKSTAQTDAAMERVQAAVENLSERNRNVLELREWFVNIMNDPKLFYDPAFVEWMKGIVGRQLPASPQPRER
jgi:hypothetical protein